jgi:hypothetical protein
MIRMPQLARLMRSNAINAAGLLLDQLLRLTRHAPHAPARAHVALQRDQHGRPCVPRTRSSSSATHAELLLRQ